VGDVNWWSVVGADDFNHLPASVELHPGARRYDAHEPASFNNLIPLSESLRLLLELGPAAVQAHARSLLDRLAASLPEGFSVASPEAPAQRSHVLCVRASSPRATREAHERLAAAKVVTALRGDRIRVAPHVYNGPEDVDRLLAALAGRAR
jgi:selenocysteine lyase/cysteine desulfurase